MPRTHRYHVNDAGRAILIAVMTRLADGTIYAGVWPDTGKTMYAAPADAPLTCTLNQAKEYAWNLWAHGQRD